MPDANETKSPKKKGLTLTWTVVLVFFALLFLFAVVAPKFGRFQVGAMERDASRSGIGSQHDLG